MTWRELSPEKLNQLREPLLVDVRSPCEHAAESIPGAVNVPLLSDSERAEIGTIYKHEGEVIARRRALTFIAPKIPQIVETLLAMRKPCQPTVVHCWRGGLRSEAVCSFLSIIGIDCWRLTGGYKAWRAQVLEDFRCDRYPFRAIVINGLTGVGKTEILQCLQSMGLPVLDLEELANHRGSVFGGMGRSPQPSQKNFDARLWQKLRELTGGDVFVEAESRKVGRLALPDCVYQRIKDGVQILVKGSLDGRAGRIVADYARTLDEAGRESALAMLRTLKPYLGARRIAEIEAMVLAGRLTEAVRSLLLDYYDPLYQRQIDRQAEYAFAVETDDPELAAGEIAQWLASEASRAQQASGSAQTAQKELPPVDAGGKNFCGGLGKEET